MEVSVERVVKSKGYILLLLLKSRAFPFMAQGIPCSGNRFNLLKKSAVTVTGNPCCKNRQSLLKPSTAIIVRIYSTSRGYIAAACIYFNENRGILLQG